jgi:hypothetical protein
MRFDRVPTMVYQVLLKRMMDKVQKTLSIKLYNPVLSVMCISADFDHV